MKHKLIISCLLLLVLTSFTALAAETRTLRNTPKHKVELYVTSWCPYCKKARNFLESQGIEYRLYDIERDAVAARRKQLLAPNSGVPVAIIDGNLVRGWSQRAYEAALDK